METLSLPKSVLLKEIIRYEEDMYILNAEAEFYTGWEYTNRSLYIRADVKALSELLRLENPLYTGKIEDVLLSMLSFGEPSRIDIKELTGDYLLLRNSEIILKNFSSTATLSGSIHDLAQLIDVFPTFYTQSLGHYLTLENEFSKEILEKNFYDFQKAFFLIDRGYKPEVSAALTHTNNPISAMIYTKIKLQLDPEETVSPIATSNEDIIEENYSFNELVTANNSNLPF